MTTTSGAKWHKYNRSPEKTFQCEFGDLAHQRSRDGDGHDISKEFVCAKWPPNAHIGLCGLLERICRDLQ